MNEPRKSPGKAVRASDAERERIARMVSDAAGEGRLTLAEAEERLSLIYTTQFRHELAEFVADLPAQEPAGGRAPLGPPDSRFPARLRVHAAVAVVLSVFLIVRWVASEAPFFWPAGPMFLLFGSLLLHTRYVYWARGTGARRHRQWGPPPWWVEPQGEAAGRPDGRKDREIDHD